MSGGSWDYQYQNLESLARRLSEEKNIKRRMLGRLVKKVSEALHDIEWVDSGDYGEDEDIKAIDACLKFKISEELKEDIKEYINELRRLLEDKKC